MVEKENLKGLTSAQAQKLLEQHGYNEIKPVKKFTLLKSFLSQFDNFLTLLLLIAAIISFFVGERLDSFFIFGIVVINAFFGLYQEFKAEKALESLKKITITNTRVIRDGKEKLIDSRFLVPGDLIYLDEGTKIPADGQILKSWHLEVNEASLTGESFPVEKNLDEQKKYLYLGTVVSRGRGYAQVIKTGEKTKFGQIAKTLSEIEGVKTPLEKKLEVFTKQVGLVGIAASVIVFILSFIQDKTLIESFVFSVSLAVAAVPEGLPAVMTITLAIGVEVMAVKKAIVRKLNSIEALGSVTLVATDKTGTLTANIMRVKKIWVDNRVYNSDKLPTLNNFSFSRILLDGILCSTASIIKTIDHGGFEVIGDQTEGALLLLANKVGLPAQSIKNDWQIVDEIAFNSLTKRMTVVVKKGKETLVFSKGAPESILSLCRLNEAKKIQISKEFEKFARVGLRIIAFSYKKHESGENHEKNQIFLGFVGIADPIRPEVAQAVKIAQKAGIKVVMITGDNQLTAEAVGIESGIIKVGDEILNGEQLEVYSDQEVAAILPKVKIFSRTTPNHKYRLVKLFQTMGEIVAVTGDGVNDALALEQADVGVAMGISGTDVAKETADMIITDDNFASLISAIEQGRNIFNNLKNAIKYLLACNIGEVIYILSAVIFGLPLLAPLQLLYINIVTDGLPAISLAFAPNDRHIMNRKPLKLAAILQKNDFKYIFFLGILTAGLAFISTIPFKGSTVLFTTIILVQPFILLDRWLSGKSLLKNFHLLLNPIFLIAFFFPFALQPVLLYNSFLNQVFKTNPLTPIQLCYSVLVAFLILVAIEARKLVKLSF